MSFKFFISILFIATALSNFTQAAKTSGEICDFLLKNIGKKVSVSNGEISLSTNFARLSNETYFQSAISRLKQRIILTGKDDPALGAFNFAPYGSEMVKLAYYVLRRTDTNEIVGVTGLYAVKDRPEAWIGWYGIKSDARGRGYGRVLLDWTIKRVLIWKS